MEIRMASKTRFPLPSSHAARRPKSNRGTFSMSKKDPKTLTQDIQLFDVEESQEIAPALNSPQHEKTHPGTDTHGAHQDSPIELPSIEIPMVDQIPVEVTHNPSQQWSNDPEPLQSPDLPDVSDSPGIPMEPTFGEHMEPSFHEEPRFPPSLPAQPPTSEPSVELSERQERSRQRLTTIKDRIAQLQPDVQSIQSSEVQLSDNQGEILKKYLTLKEAEVRDLREQQSYYEAQQQKLEAKIYQLTARNQELTVEHDVLKRHEMDRITELAHVKSRHKEELSALRAEFEDQIRKSGKAGQELESLASRKEEWKQKIREELKRIKLKERELENKYELLKRDTQALLDSKDQHVLELKRRSDALELEMETLEEKLRTTNTILADVDAKRDRLVETLKLVLSLLQDLGNSPK